MSAASQEVRQMLAHFIADDDAEVDPELDVLIAAHGWEAIHAGLIDVLIDEHAGDDLWQTSASILFGEALVQRPMDENLVIGLVYHRLKPDEGSTVSNLAWSIACKLKRLDYMSSDYDPFTDAEVIAALERQGIYEFVRKQVS